MKKIIITQRLELFGIHGELRDNVDVRLTQFVETIGFMPILIPNNIKKLDFFLKSLKPHGIILSGGGDAFKKDKRSELETKLIKFCIKKKIPLLGICRGAQAINKYFGGKQKKIENHVRKNHIVFFLNNIYRPSLTNSYHESGFDKILMSKKLKILGTSSDNIVKYFTHEKHKISGIMWHPERYKKVKPLDKKIFYKIFKK